tara:strand:- start:552 stop:1013 length:462 start_codon:yes stop_codon:yes gene_type:complete
MIGNTMNIYINLTILDIITSVEGDKAITILNIPVMDRYRELNDVEINTTYLGFIKTHKMNAHFNGDMYPSSRRSLSIFGRDIYSFSSLNDGTKGARFYILGLKGIKRTRLIKSKGLKVSNGKSTKILDLFKTTIYFEKRSNKRSNRKLTSTFA